jgi:hypothetical protein
MIDWAFVWTLVVAFVICLVIYYIERMIWEAMTRNRRR